MNSIKCGQCGLINWAATPACKRCQTPLAAAGSSTPPGVKPEGPTPAGLEDPSGHDAPPPANVCSFCGTHGAGTHCPLCRKPFSETPSAARAERPSLLPALASQKVLAAVLGLLLVAVAAAFAYKGGLLFKPDENAELAEQIEASAQFKEPLYVHLPANGTTAPAGAEVLRERGLITVRSGSAPAGSVWSAPVANARTQLWGLGESQSHTSGGDRVLVGLTETGINASAKWQQQTLGDSTRVWLVPVGGRELVEIKEVKKPPMPTGEDYLRMPPSVREFFPPAKDQPSLMVGFNWRWSPNDLGLFFDINSGEFKSLPLKAQQSARACIYSDSKALRAGTAYFKKEGEKLVLQYVHFDETPLPAPAATP